MSAAKQTCQLDGCNRAASACCLCCNKNVCTRHFTEHVDAVKAQLDPLADETNLLLEKVRNRTVEQLMQTSVAQLQQWKNDMHQLVDDIFVVKRKELEELVEKNKDRFDEHQKYQLEQMIEIQDEMRQVGEDGDATYAHIQRVKNRLADTETSLISFGKDFLSIHTKIPDQGLVTISSNLNQRSVNGPSPSQSENSQNTFLSEGIGSSVGSLNDAATTTATGTQKPSQFAFFGYAPMSSSKHTEPSSTPTVRSSLFGEVPFFTTQTTTDVKPKPQCTNKPSIFQGTAGPKFSFPTSTTTASSLFATTTPIFGAFSTASPSTSSAPQVGSPFGFGSTAGTAPSLFGSTTTTTPSPFDTPTSTASFMFGGRK